MKLCFDDALACRCDTNAAKHSKECSESVQSRGRFRLDHHTGYGALLPAVIASDEALRKSVSAFATAPACIV